MIETSKNEKADSKFRTKILKSVSENSLRQKLKKKNRSFLNLSQIRP